MNALQEIAVFLISTLFQLYIVVVMLRILLGWAKADFYNPISQFIVNLTNPVLLPIRRFIPSLGKIDTAAVVLALSLMVVKLLLLALLGDKAYPGFGLLIVFIFFVAILDLIKLTIWIFIFSLIVEAVISWLGNSYNNPVASITFSLNQPLLKPLRRFNLSVGMVDLTPLAAILLLQVLLILIESIAIG